MKEGGKLERKLSLKVFSADISMIVSIKLLEYLLHDCLRLFFFFTSRFPRHVKMYFINVSMKTLTNDANFTGSR
jgi:hypothetical protein